MDAIAISKPVLLAWASIRMEDESKLDTEQEYCISLGKTNGKVVAFTKMCEVSARMLPEVIHKYIEKESLTEAVLKCVNLSNNSNMCCKRLGRVVELLKGFHIQGMDLSGNPQLSNSTVAAIQPLLEARGSKLTELRLADCGLTIPGLKRLVKNASKSRLRVLDISHIGISGESELIEQMLELPMIEELAFCFCDLEPEDVRTVAQALPFTGVKRLYLLGNNFGSQGLVHLASTLSESMVEVLDLSRVGLEKRCEGLTQLAKAWVKRPFPKLFLRSNPMGHTEVLNFVTSLQTLVPSGQVDDTFMGNIAKCC